MAIPLMLPMGWNNSPSIFCMTTETVDDIENDALRSHSRAQTHPIHYRVDKVVILPPPLINPSLAAIPRHPILNYQNADLLVYINIFWMIYWY